MYNLSGWGRLWTRLGETGDKAGGDWGQGYGYIDVATVRADGDLVCRGGLDVFTESAITLFGFDLKLLGGHLTDVHRV